MPQRWPNSAKVVLTTALGGQVFDPISYSGGDPDFRAVLTLFIDDQGVVQRVRVDAAQDSGLPAALEEATRQTFLRSAFVPGELDGRPVRSQLRIEVEFTTEPADTGTHTASR